MAFSDGGGFAGEDLLQVFAEALEAGGEVEDLAVDEEAIVDAGHGLPLDLAGGDVVEGAADGGVVLHLADVVEADVPVEAGATEGVGVAAGLVVALEDEDAFAGVEGEEDGGGEASDAGADDDGVPLVGEGGLLVGGSGGHGLLLQVKTACKPMLTSTTSLYPL